MDTCSKCGMPIDKDSSCSCEPILCVHCCACEPDCSCGCSDMAAASNRDFDDGEEAEAKEAE